MTHRYADDVDAIKKRIDRLTYERRMSPMMAGCAAYVGGKKSECEQCKDAPKCFICKNHQDGNQDGARGCLLCDEKGDGSSYTPCPNT